MNTIVFEAVHSPVWADNEQSAVTLQVKVAATEQEFPFTASPDDPEPHGVDLYNRATSGEFGPIAAYVAPSGTALLSQYKAENAHAMAAIQTKIAPLSAAQSLGVATQEELDYLTRLQQELVDLYRAEQKVIALGLAEVRPPYAS